MSANNEKRSKPSNISFFGPPPLLEGEDPEAYDDLLEAVTGSLKPSDAIEEILANDFANFTWQGRRWQRLMASLLYETSQADPAAYGFAVLILLGTGLLASIRPAWKAATRDPLEALRSE